MHDRPLTPHGYALTPDDERLLRGAPPPEAMAWCARAVGTGAEVVSVAALQGGTSSAVHAIDVRSGAGRTIGLVLRRFVRADWLAREPDLARREAEALTLLRDSAVPAPRLVAVEPTGGASGVPAVLMTRLDGAVTWAPDDLEAFLRALAGALEPIHAVGVPAGTVLPDYRPYALQLERPPAWTARPSVWERAFAVFDAPPPPPPVRRFVHRDFHPGNVLWADGRVAGVVDWVNASVGSPLADVGHCRVNLVRAFGIDAAERFLALHGGPYHPYWDVVAAVGGFDEHDVARWTPREEDFLARAVAAL